MWNGRVITKVAEILAPYIPRRGILEKLISYKSHLRWV
jgi:hypothetical protein